MCVYAITMEDSYEKLENFFEQILRVTDKEDKVNFVTLLLPLSLPLLWRYDQRPLSTVLCHLVSVPSMQQVPFVLVGNKCDLEDERQVDTVRGAELAAKYNCPFLETSAKTNTNVEEGSYGFKLIDEIVW